MGDGKLVKIKTAERLEIKSAEELTVKKDSLLKDRPDAVNKKKASGKAGKPVTGKDLLKKSEKLPVIMPEREKTEKALAEAKERVIKAYGQISLAEIGALGMDAHDRRRKHHLEALSESDINKRAKEALGRSYMASAIKDYEAEREKERIEPGDLDREEFVQELNKFMKLPEKAHGLDTDEKFAENLAKNYRLCDAAVKMKKWVSDAVNGGYLPEDAELDNIEERIQGYLDLKDFLDTKKSLIKNPYYSYLSDKDVNYSSEQLERLTRTTKNQTLREYLEDIKKLRQLPFVQSRGMESVKHRAELEGKRQAELLNTMADKRLFAARLEEDALSFRGSFGFTTKGYDKKFTRKRLELLMEEFGAISLHEIRMGDFRDMVENFRSNALLFEKARRMQHMLFLARKNNVNIADDTLRAMSAKIRVFNMYERLMYGIQKHMLLYRDKDLNEKTYKEIEASVRQSLSGKKSAGDIGYPSLGDNIEKYYLDVLKVYRKSRRERNFTEDYLADTGSYAEETYERMMDSFLLAYEKRNGKKLKDLERMSVLRTYLMGASSDRVREVVRILEQADREGKEGEEGRQRKADLMRKVLREYGDMVEATRVAKDAAEDDCAYKVRMRKLSMTLSDEEKQQAVRLAEEERDKADKKSEEEKKSGKKHESVLKGVELAEIKCEYLSRKQHMEAYSEGFKEENLSVSKRQKLLTDPKSELFKKQTLAKRVTDGFKDGANKYISARRSISLANRIKAGDRVLEDLSAFMTGEKKADNDLVSQFMDEKRREEVLDRLTREIGEFSVDLKLATDELFAANAGRLEEMTRKAYAYRSLLRANPDYAEKLRRREEGKGTSDMAKLKRKLNVMLSISDYYRARKLLMTDPYYILHKNRELGTRFGSGMEAEQRTAGELIDLVSRCAARLDMEGFSDRAEDGIEEELLRRETKARKNAFVTGRCDIAKADVSKVTKDFAEIRKYIDAAGLDTDTYLAVDAGKTDDNVPYPEAEKYKTEAASNYINAVRHWGIQKQNSNSRMEKLIGERNNSLSIKLQKLLVDKKGELIKYFSYTDPKTGEIFKLSTTLTRLYNYIAVYGEDLPEEEIIEICEGLTLQEREEPDLSDEATREYVRNRWLDSMQKLFYMQYNYALKNENTIGTVKHDMPIGCFMQSIGDGLKTMVIRSHFGQDLSNMVDDNAKNERTSRTGGEGMTAAKLLIKYGRIKQEEYDHLRSTILEYYQNGQTRDNGYYSSPYQNFGNASEDKFEYSSAYCDLEVENITENQVHIGGPKLTHAKQREMWKKALKSNDVNLTSSEDNVEFQKHRLNLYTKSERRAIIKKRKKDQSIYALYNFHLDERTEKLLERTRSKLGEKVPEDILNNLITFHPGLLKDDIKGQDSAPGEEQYYERIKRYLGIGVEEARKKEERQKAYGELIASWNSDFVSFSPNTIDEPMTRNRVRENEKKVLNDSLLLKNEVSHRRFIALQDMASGLYTEGLLTEEHQRNFREKLRLHIRYEISRSVIQSRRYAELRDVGDRHSTVPERMYDELIRMYYLSVLGPELPVDGLFLTDRAYRALEYFGIRMDRPYEIKKPEKEAVYFDKTSGDKKDLTEGNKPPLEESREKSHAEEENREQPHDEEIPREQPGLTIEEKRSIYNAEAKRVHEEALRAGNIPVPANRDDVVAKRGPFYKKKFRQMDADGVMRDDFTWNDDADPVMMEHYDWLMEYYKVNDKSLELNQDSNRDIPVLEFKNHTSKMELTGLDEIYEQQRGLNCYCCSGAALISQFVSNRRVKENPDADKTIKRCVRQQRMRNYRPALRKHDPADDELIDIEGYDRAVEEIDIYAGENKEGVGSIFAMGDFILQSLEDRKINDAMICKMIIQMPKIRNERDIKKYGNMRTIFADRISGIIDGGGIVGVLMADNQGMAHYVTVTEIDGEYLKVYDSSGYSGHPKTMHIDDFIKENSLVELNWIEDLKSPETLTAEYQNLAYDEQTGYSLKNKTRNHILESIPHTRGITVIKDGYELGDAYEGVTQMAYIPDSKHKADTISMDDAVGQVFEHRAAGYANLQKKEEPVYKRAFNTVTIEKEEEKTEERKPEEPVYKRAFNTVTIEKEEEKTEEEKPEEPVYKRAFNTVTIEKEEELTSGRIRDYNDKVNDLLRDSEKRFERNISRNRSVFSLKHTGKRKTDNINRVAVMAGYPGEGESQEAFRLYNTLTMDTDKMDSADKKAFTGELERLFAKILDFDLNELKFKSVDDLGRMKYMKARLYTTAMVGIEDLAREYEKLIDDKDAGCLLNADQLKEVRAKIVTLEIFRNLFDKIPEALGICKRYNIDIDKVIKGEAEGMDQWENSELQDMRTLYMFTLVIKHTRIPGYVAYGSDAAPVYEHFLEAQGAQGGEKAAETRELLKQSDAKLKAAYRAQKDVVSFIPYDTPFYEADGSYDMIKDKQIASFKKKKQNAVDSSETYISNRIKDRDKKQKTHLKTAPFQDRWVRHLASGVAYLSGQSKEESWKMYQTIMADPASMNAKQKSERAFMYEKVFKVILEFDLSRMNFMSFADIFGGDKTEAAILTRTMHDFHPAMLKDYENLMKEKGVNCALSEEQFKEVRARWEFLHMNSGWFNELANIMPIAKKHKINLIEVINMGADIISLVNITKDAELKQFYIDMYGMVAAAKDSGFGPGVKAEEAIRKIRAKYGLGYRDRKDDALYAINVRNAERMAETAKEKDQKTVLYPSVERELRHIDEIYKGSGIPPKELQKLKDNIRITGEYKLSMENALPEKEKEEGTGFAGIDRRDYHALFRPVRLNSKGEPMTEQDRKNREANLRDHAGYRSGKLSERKQHLDYIAEEAMRLYMTPAQLSSSEYILSHREQAVRFISFMHTIANRYTMHRNYYMTKVNEETRVFMFLIGSALPYAEFASQRINYVLYGAGYGSAIIGTSTNRVAEFLSYEKGVKYKDVREVNDRIEKMYPGFGITAVSTYNTLRDQGRNPFDKEGREEIEEALDTGHEVGFTFMSRPQQHLLKSLKGNPEKKDIPTAEIKKFSEDTMEEFFQKRKDKDYIKKMLGIIDSYMKSEGGIGNAEGVIDDL